MRIKSVLLTLVLFNLCPFFTQAQITTRTRPAMWNNLVFGGRFMDRFLPMPRIGELTADTWGAQEVLPRYTGNGIENNTYSFWGGNIKLGEDGKYHFYVCGWPENSSKGHAFWPKSTVFHAVADNSFGPFTVQDTIGPGHNPEVFKLSDGRYVIYVIDGYYIADGCNGPWKYGRFEFLNRDRRIIEGLSNLTFTQREDGSWLMVCRGGGIWLSRTGISPYNQVTEKRVYPPVAGNFEDPVVWRDNIQYNLIVNDWLGRVAWYLRSKDGISWKVESGEAYQPGIAKHEDGTVEGWFKLERMKIFQDQYGRAIQANFAVIDVEKKFDKGNDNHSSKNIGIPLTPGRLLTILGNKKLTPDTKTIRVKIAAENGFNPHTDIDINTLRFGDPEEVNYGRGSKALKTKKLGNDLEVTFDWKGNKMAEDEFAAKLLGTTRAGKLLFGYAGLPGVDFTPPLLSACLPVFTSHATGFNIKVEVQNFGQKASGKATIKIMYTKDQKETEIASGIVPGLKPFQKTDIELTCGKILDEGVAGDFTVIIHEAGNKPVTLHGKITPGI